MNVGIGIGFGNVRMFNEFPNVYSSLSLIVTTLVRQLVSTLKNTISKAEGFDRGHICS